MIQVKNSEQVAIMRKAGRITGEALLKAAENIQSILLWRGLYP